MHSEMTEDQFARFFEYKLKREKLTVQTLRLFEYFRKADIPVRFILPKAEPENLNEAVDDQKNSKFN